MRILIIGSGGREHAIGWKLAQSPLCESLYFAPGNAGTSGLGENVPLDTSDHQAVKNFINQTSVEMLIIGPEAPLVDGLVDYLKIQEELEELMIIGPSRAAAMLEGSKAFAKEFMAEFNIPTAAYREFSARDIDKAMRYLDQVKGPYVLKADGLAAGKGVLIINDIEEAKLSLKEMFSGKFGDAGKKVVIEDFLDGIEFSVFVLTDGKDYVILPEAKDYKRIGEGDTGLNTGGMGAISPVPFVDEMMMNKVEERIIKPTIHGIQKRQMDYIGFIFLGLINIEGDPFVIEYNCRMGDPETEAVFPRIKTDMIPVFSACAKKQLAETSIDILEDAAAAVMLVSGGYPEAYKKGFEIKGTENVDQIVFHAGTKTEQNQILTNGGRVIAVTAYGADHHEAVKRAMEGASKIRFKGKYFRRDIGFDL